MLGRRALFRIIGSYPQRDQLQSEPRPQGSGCTVIRHRNSETTYSVGRPGVEVQGVAHFLRQLHRRKRLVEEGRSLLDALLQNHVLGVTRHEHDFQPGAEFEGCFGEFALAQFRHHHVGHQQIDLARMGFAQLQDIAPTALLSLSAGPGGEAGGGVRGSAESRAYWQSGTAFPPGCGAAASAMRTRQKTRRAGICRQPPGGRRRPHERL